MEKWIESELKRRWQTLMNNPVQLEDILNYAKGNNPLLSETSKRRTEILILDSMRRDIENSIQEIMLNIEEKTYVKRR